MQSGHDPGSSGFRFGADLRSELEKRGFMVVDYTDTKGCVDLIARRGSTLFIIRVLSNVDSLREESVMELLKLACVLDGYPVVVGEKKKSGILEENVVYRRYGVPVLTKETFLRAVDGDFPMVEEYKGKRIVFIDGGKMRKRRKEMKYTMGELADLIGTTKESIYRYEHGYPASEETAKKIERVLGEKVVRPVDVFRKRSVEKRVEGIYRSLVRVGFEACSFSRTPWDALAKKETVITFSEYRGDIRRKKELFERGKGVAMDLYAFVCPENKKAPEVPHIYEHELEEITRADDLVKIVRERNEEQ